MMNVQFQNEETLRSYFAQLSGNLSQMQEVYREIGDEIRAAIAQRFNTQSDPLGNPWPAWHPQTAIRAGKKGRNRLLVEHGTMLRSLYSKPAPDGVVVGFAQRNTDDEQPYALYHEYGVKVGGKERLPRRGMVFADPERQTLSAEDEQAALDAVQQYLRNIIHGD